MLYDADFYDAQSSGSYGSALIIVPLLLRLMVVRSVCDVGCGLGTWLRAFRENGVRDVLGIDGDYVQRERLQVPVESFRPADLTLPIASTRKFDVAVSLEVAEHLPSASASAFVKSLASLSDVVLFSAAVPGQRGTGHVNEQWQSYWAKLFAGEDYVTLDPIRPAVWGSPVVTWWYKQNMLLYVRRHALTDSLAAHAAVNLDIVHPDCYLPHLSRGDDIEDLGFLTVASTLPRLFVKAVGRRGWRS